MIRRLVPRLVLSQSMRPMSTTMASTVPETKRQPFDYLLVLDFEATCDKGSRQPFPQEIIEFPCLKLNASTWNVDAQFHRYVRPTAHPILTSFCTDLTGIVQDMVDSQTGLHETLVHFDDWLKSEGLSIDSNSDAPSSSWAFVTCGDWDLKVMLRQQCDHFGYPRADYFRRWINIKKIFFQQTKIFPKGMLQMLEALDLHHEGRHHSGIDDSRNIARVATALAQKGSVFSLTSHE